MKLIFIILLVCLLLGFLQIVAGYAVLGASEGAWIVGILIVAVPILIWLFRQFRNIKW